MLAHRDRRTTQRWAKIGPPLRGRVSSPSGFVATLTGATSPCFAILLSGGAADVMRTLPPDRNRL